MANYWHKRSFAELSTEPEDLAERGLVYLMHRRFTILGSGSVAFAMLVQDRSVQFQNYEITTTTSPIFGELREAPSYTLSSASFAAYNLNRDFPDAHTAMLYSASAVSGGTAIASELVGNTSKAGATIQQGKTQILRQNTAYVMTFLNLANQDTDCHLNLSWTERHPTPYTLVTEGINSGGVT